MQIIVEGKPLAKQRPFGVKTNSGKVRMFTPEQTTNYENFVKLKAVEAFGEQKPFSGVVSIDMTFYLPRPQYLIWKKKPMPVVLCDKRPDLDNLAKAVLDGLNGVAFYDDKQIAMMRLIKCYHSGNNKPKVVIDLKEVDSLSGDF